MNLRTFAKHYYVLTKPRVVQLIVFCALIGMVLAIPRIPTPAELGLMLQALIGIWLIAGSAAAFNCMLEKGIDAKMQRTAWRATARGLVHDWQNLLVSSLLCIAGAILLYIQVNSLTMWLTLGAFAGYAFIYTLVLKPLTSQNIVIGGASGAMPPVLGWVAMTNQMSLEPLLLFLIIFIWTPPHFWALALYRLEDYRKVNLPMLPVTHGSAYTRLQIFLYTMILLGVCILPFAIGMSGLLYLLVAILMSLRFCWYGYQLWRQYSEPLAKRCFRFSIWHLSVVFAAMLVDHYLAIGLYIAWSI